MPIFQGGCGSSLTGTLAACMSASLGEITVNISLISSNSRSSLDNIYLWVWMAITEQMNWLNQFKRNPGSRVHFPL